METWQVLGQRSDCSSCGKNKIPIQRNVKPIEYQESASRVTAEYQQNVLASTEYHQDTNRIPAECQQYASQVPAEHLLTYTNNMLIEYQQNTTMMRITKILTEYQQNTNKIPPEYRT